jgi:hypothetical protein
MNSKDRCTYDHCSSTELGGLVDSSMRPWHNECAKAALAKYGRDNLALYGWALFFITLLILTIEVAINTPWTLQ